MHTPVEQVPIPAASDVSEKRTSWLVRVSVFNPYLVIVLCLFIAVTPRDANPRRAFVLMKTEAAPTHCHHVRASARQHELTPREPVPESATQQTSSFLASSHFGRILRLRHFAL